MKSNSGETVVVGDRRWSSGRLTSRGEDGKGNGFGGVVGCAGAIQGGERERWSRLGAFGGAWRGEGGLVDWVLEMQVAEGERDEEMS